MTFPCASRWRISLALLIVSMASGCRAPSDTLRFPTGALTTLGDDTWYDVGRNGKADFATRLDAAGKIESILYDDNEDGRADREYRLGEYANDRVPHLVLLLDSIPFSVVADRYAAGHFRFADPPLKVISGFPSLTEVCYSDVLHTLPRDGMIDEYFDRRVGEPHAGLWQRLDGYEEPWERRLDYHAKFWEGGLSYLEPRDWLRAEVARAHDAVDKSPNRVTLAYVISASGMACKYGRPGMEETLDAAERLCLQLLYERQGAIKISVMADHGHNLTPSSNLHVADVLKADGFRPSDMLKDDKDVVIEMHGLVNYCGFHTREPAKIADSLLKRDEVEFALYVSGERVVIRSRDGESSVVSRGGKVAYIPGEADLLKLKPTLEAFRAAGKLAEDGGVSDDDWLTATADADYPDAPRRIWDAFHGKTVNPPDLMITLKDGYCAGMPSLEKFITMKSTHGSLNQMNTATFVMTMTGRGGGTAMRGHDVMQRIEPGYVAPIRR